MKNEEIRLQLKEHKDVFAEHSRQDSENFSAIEKRLDKIDELLEKLEEHLRNDAQFKKEDAEFKQDVKPILEIFKGLKFSKKMILGTAGFLATIIGFILLTYQLLEKWMKN